MPGKRFQPELEGFDADFAEPEHLCNDPQLSELRARGLVARLDARADVATPHDGEGHYQEPAALPPCPNFLLQKARAQRQDEPPEEEHLRRGPRRAGRDHHPEVDRFLDRVSEYEGRRITINEFCLVAGYKDDTILGHWRRGSKKCKPAQALKFKRVLQLSNEEFMRRLTERSRKL
jgi:hypothetical protein